MIISDSFSMRPEAVQYSIELAKRMNYTLNFLILLPFDIDEISKFESDFVYELENRAKKTLLIPMKSAREAGLNTEAEVRIGNPASELMKFLAKSKTIETLVWGGVPELSNYKKEKTHWLVRIKDSLECSIVVPSLKS